MIGAMNQVGQLMRVFGKVIEGMDVVNKIGNVQTSQGDRPVTPVQMKKITVHEG